MTETETRSAVQFLADANVEQASSSEPQQVETLKVQSVEPESSISEHTEPMEAIVEEAETSAIEQSFLAML